MLQVILRRLVLSLLVSAVVLGIATTVPSHAAGSPADPTNRIKRAEPHCLQLLTCGGVRILDADEEVQKRIRLREQVAQDPDDAEAIRDLLGTLRAEQGVDSERQALYRELRRLEPEAEDAWCGDLYTDTTLAEAKRLAAQDPSHWLIPACLAGRLAGSEPELADRMIDGYLAAAGFFESISAPGYRLSPDDWNLLQWKLDIALDEPERFVKLMDLAESSGGPELRYTLADFILDQAAWGELTGEPVSWAEATFEDLLDADLQPSQTESLCERLADDQRIAEARRCYEGLLSDFERFAASDPDYVHWLSAAHGARGDLIQLDLDEGRWDSAFAWAAEGPAFGRMDSWQRLFHGLHRSISKDTDLSEDTAKSAFCGHLAGAWHGGAFEDEVLADPDACPRRLEILVKLMTECELAPLLKERIAASD